MKRCKRCALTKHLRRSGTAIGSLPLAKPQPSRASLIENSPGFEGRTASAVDFGVTYRGTFTVDPWLSAE